MSVSKLCIGRFVDTTARRTLHDAWCLNLQHRRDVVQRPHHLCVVVVGRPPPARTSLLRVIGAGSVLRVIA
jgi:hypothetical protein